MGPKPRIAPRIEYFSATPAAPGEGFRSAWNADADDPTSDGFVPMEERSSQDQARWWAFIGKRSKTRQAVGVM